MAKKDPRYAKSWPKLSAFTRTMLMGRCCLCLRKSSAVHHAYYGVRLGALISAIAAASIIYSGWGTFHQEPLSIQGTVQAALELSADIQPWRWLALLAFLIDLAIPIPGFEIPGWQIFPLCDRHHSNSRGCAHHRRNYIVSRITPWQNHNITPFLWRMRIGFWLTLSFVWLWPILLLIAIANIN